MIFASCLHGPHDGVGYERMQTAAYRFGLPAVPEIVNSRDRFQTQRFLPLLAKAFSKNPHWADSLQAVRKTRPENVLALPAARRTGTKSLWIGTLFGLLSLV